MSVARRTPAPASLTRDRGRCPTRFAPPHDAMLEVYAVDIGSRGSVLRATGEVDLATAGYLGRMLEQQHKAGRSLIRLDLSEVSFMDCAGIGALVDAHHRFLADGSTLVLTGVGPRIARLLELTGVDQTLFTIVGQQSHRPPRTSTSTTRVGPSSIRRWGS